MLAASRVWPGGARAAGRHRGSRPGTGPITRAGTTMTHLRGSPTQADSAAGFACQGFGGQERVMMAARRARDCWDYFLRLDAGRFNPMNTGQISSFRN